MTFFEGSFKTEFLTNVKKEWKKKNQLILEQKLYQALLTNSGCLSLIC